MTCEPLGGTLTPVYPANPTLLRLKEYPVSLPVVLCAVSLAASEADVSCSTPVDDNHLLIEHDFAAELRQKVVKKMAQKSAPAEWRAHL